MNFQPSVIIWTVICFLLLTVILRNLLFAPVLKILDERNERIEAAKGKKAEIEKLTRENEEYLAAEREKELKKKSDEAKELAFKIQSDGKREIDLAQRQCLAEIEKYSHVATLDEIAENEYNLNIPRYVDTFEEEEIINIDEVNAEIADLKTRIAEVEKQMAKYLEELGLN